MNTRYCPFCAFCHKWELQKPKVCAKCSKDMDAAFASVTPPPAPAYVPPYRSTRPETRQSHRRFYDAHGNDITDRFIKPQPSRPQYREDDEEYVDEYAKEDLARELSASIEGAEHFSFGLDDEGSDKSIKLGSIIQQAIANQPAPQGGKKQRKARKQ